MVAQSNDPVVSLTDVRKTYKVGEVDVPAVKGVTFSIPRRRFSVIVGPSGSGKTTLLNLIGCLDKPTSGRVIVAGQDLATLTDNAVSDFRAQKVGFIFQNFSLIPVFSAYENIEYPLLVLGVSAKERGRRATAMLEAVGLVDHGRQRANQLSGGLRPKSRQPRVFRPCFPEQRNVRVGVLFHREEIVVSAFRVQDVAGERTRSRELQARHGIQGVDENDASMIENPLEFAGGFGWLTCHEVRQAANVDRVQTAETSREADAAKCEIVA